MKIHTLLFIVLHVGLISCIFVENEAPRRFARSIGDTYEVVTAQAQWSDQLMNWEDSWYFMEDRIANYNDTLVGRPDRTYLRNALDNFQARLSANVQFLRAQGTDSNTTVATAAIGYADMLEGGLRCSANGALDALDTYTCDVMTDGSEPLDDVLFSLLKGDQHVNLAVADPVLEQCEWSLAVEEWNATLQWVYANGLVNAAHEYVLDMARRQALLQILHLSETTQGCALLSQAIAAADTDLPNLSPAEQTISTPKLDDLRSDECTHCTTVLGAC